jgi:hypothetical protein
MVDPLKRGTLESLGAQILALSTQGQVYEETADAALCRLHSYFTEPGDDAGGHQVPPEQPFALPPQIRQPAAAVHAPLTLPPSYPLPAYNPGLLPPVAMGMGNQVMTSQFMVQPMPFRFPQNHQ